MDQKALVKEWIDSGAKFLYRLQEHVPIKVAYWLYATVDPHWYLYVASKKVSEHNPYEAYRDVVRVASEQPDPYVGMFRVMLVADDDPVAEEVFEIRSRYPDPIPIHYFDMSLGGLYAEEIYVYPLPIKGLMNSTTSL